MKEQTKLYVAYGSNLNQRQMKNRCPTAKLYGVGEIRDYELQFKGMPDRAFATIAPKEGASVPAAVWTIRPMDEFALDRYEGYPTHYGKQTVTVDLGDRSVDAMVYVMNPKMDFGMPSYDYYRIVAQGYTDCHLDTDVLNEAVDRSVRKFYDIRSQREQEEEESFGFGMGLE